MVEASTVVHRWVAAYNERRDDDLCTLAHAAIVLKPMRAQGRSEYRGLDGLRSWLDDTGSAQRLPLEVGTIECLRDGRVILDGTVDGMPVAGVFEVEDGKIIAAQGYHSDREMLERLGVIPGRE